MRKTTKLLVAGLAGSGLLLTACEVPGGGIPPRTIVFPEIDGDTPFSGFPATFKGTNVIGTQLGDVSTSGIFDWYDQFVTEVDGSLDLLITCDVYDEGTAVYVDSSAGDAFMVCEEDGPTLEVTVSGPTEIEIGNYSEEPNTLHPYSIRADIDDTPNQS